MLTKMSNKTNLFIFDYVIFLKCYLLFYINLCKTFYNFTSTVFVNIIAIENTVVEYVFSVNLKDMCCLHVLLVKINI